MPIELKKIQARLRQSQTIENISSIYEITTIIRINEMRSGVMAANEFVTDLQNIYWQLLKSLSVAKIASRTWQHDKTLTLIITSSGSFSGAADEVIISNALAQAETNHNDIILIGSNKGLALLESRGIKPILGFEMPDVKRPIDVQKLVSVVNQYRNAWAYYQTFESIGLQEVNRINLLPASAAITDEEILKTKTIDPKTYIFEPSLEEITNYLHAVILNVTLTQIIFEAKLSEYANRFKTVSLVKDRAHKTSMKLTMNYSRKKRQIKDEALRQQIFQGGLR